MNPVRIVSTVAVSVICTFSASLHAEQLSERAGGAASAEERAFAEWASPSDQRSMAGHPEAARSDSLADLKNERDVTEYSYKIDAASSAGTQAQWTASSEELTLAGHPDSGTLDNLADLKNEPDSTMGLPSGVTPEDLDSMPATAAGPATSDIEGEPSEPLSPYASRDYGDASARDKRLLYIGQDN